MAIAPKSIFPESISTAADESERAAAVSNLPLRAATEKLAQTAVFGRGQVVCAEAQSAACWFRLVTGVARRYVIRDDGRRQILDLLFPGDFFGFTADSNYGSTVEAASAHAIVETYARSKVERLADADASISRALRQAAFQALAREQTQLLIIGGVRAVDKVASFLASIASREPTRGPNGGDGHTITLPVSRCDIADYLSLSVETVSRAMSELQRRRVIALCGGRSVRIINWHGLESAC
jgi:CRP/FNR family nitrogen fixation transcriptional regulator